MRVFYKLAAFAVWALDEVLDRVPTVEDGRLHRYGYWGCRLGLGNTWARLEERAEGGVLDGR